MEEGEKEVSTATKAEEGGTETKVELTTTVEGRGIEEEEEEGRG